MRGMIRWCKTLAISLSWQVPSQSGETIIDVTMGKGLPTEPWWVGESDGLNQGPPGAPLHSSPRLRPVPVDRMQSPAG